PGAPPHAGGIDVDRVFDRVAIPWPRAVRTRIRVPGDSRVTLRQHSHQIRQAALDDVTPSPLDFFVVRRSQLECPDAGFYMVQVDRADRRQVAGDCGT